MKHTAYILPLMLCAVSTVGTLSVHAQELSGSVTVEGTYNPQIRQHSRLSGLPSRYQAALPQGSLPIANGAVPTEVQPAFPAFQPADAATALPPSYDGYFRLSGGSYLNMDASAGYRFIHNDRTQFGAWLQHSSSSLFRPENDAWPEVKLPYRRRYDETIGLYGSHRVNGIGTFQADAAYHLGYFNYYSNVVSPQGVASPAPTQTLNDGSISVRYQSERPRTGWFGDGRVAFRYFGYRTLYDMDMTGHSRPQRESQLRLGATAGYQSPALGTFALDADEHLLFYTKTDDTLNDQGNYSVFSLTPAWTRQTGPWSLRLGFKLDFNPEFYYYRGTVDLYESAHLGNVHIAPDVAVSYTAGKAVFALSATGGVTPNTLADGYELDYYQAPTLLSPMPMYRPIQATLDMRFGPFSGLNFGLHATYVKAENLPFGGFYPYYLHQSDVLTDCVLDMAPSLRGFQLGADVDYTYGRLFTASASMTYQRQNERDGFFNGLDRPRWTADIAAALSPLNGLKIGVAYHYRGVRRLYLGTYAHTQEPLQASHNYDDPTESPSQQEQERPFYIRLHDVYRLGAWTSYTLQGRYTLRLDADNLLGCHSSLSTIMPDGGIELGATLSILF